MNRRARHHVAAWLAARTDREPASLSPLTSSVGVGGGTTTADADGVPVFVKRIPITGRELAHPHSTANLFGLPARRQYGMYRLPGPGFNAWRELAANRIVTAGVLADYASMRLVNWLVTTVCGVAVPARGSPDDRDRLVRRCARGDIPPDVPEPVAGIIARHALAAARMNELCRRLYDGDLQAGYSMP